MMYFAFSAFVLFFIVFLTMKFKMFSLVAGYNTASEDYKKKVDIEKIGELLSNTFLIVSIIWLIASILSIFNITTAIYIAITLTVLAILYALIGAQKHDHNPGQQKRVKITYVISLVLILIYGGLGFYFWSARKEPTVQITQQELIIEGMYGIKTPLKNIHSVELLEQFPDLNGRVNGYNEFGPVRKGDFNVKPYGLSRIFIHSESPPFLIIKHKDGTIILNSNQASKIQQLFQDLKKSHGDDKNSNQ